VNCATFEDFHLGYVTEQYSCNEQNNEEVKAGEGAGGYAEVTGTDHCTKLLSVCINLEEDSEGTLEEAFPGAAVEQALIGWMPRQEALC